MFKAFVSLSVFTLSVLAVAQNDFEFDEKEFEDAALSETTELLDEDAGFLEQQEQIAVPKRLQKKKFNPRTQGSKHSSKSKRYIYHPNQKKGLYKINRSNEYLYKYKKSKAKGFFSFRGGSLNFENFEAEGQEGLAEESRQSFIDFYNTDSLTTFVLEYDWEPFRKYRSLSLKAGLGFALETGRGQFVTPQNGVTQAREKYTFLLLPLSFGVTYKFKLQDDPLFLPYITGALDYNLAMEFRSGFEAFKYAGILGAHFGGGIGLNLGFLERAAALELDNEFGINNSYLIFEARNVVSFENDKDFSGLMVNAGLSFEF